MHLGHYGKTRNVVVSAHVAQEKEYVCVRRGLQVAGGFRFPDPPVTVDDGPQRGEREATASSPRTFVPHLHSFFPTNNTFVSQ